MNAPRQPFTAEGAGRPRVSSAQSVHRLPQQRSVLRDDVDGQLLTRRECVGVRIRSGPGNAARGGPALREAFPRHLAARAAVSVRETAASMGRSRLPPTMGERTFAEDVKQLGYGTGQVL